MAEIKKEEITKQPKPKKNQKETTSLIDSKLELYKELSSPIPKEFLVTYIEDNKEFTGYHAQYAIDLLNEKVGLGNWRTYDKIEKQELLNKGWFVSMSLQVWIGTALDDHTVPAIIVTGYGASYAKNGANAYKGAKTSAFKNACRYLGIGKELYIQGFDDDITETKEEKIISAEIVVETIASNPSSEPTIVETLITKITEAQTKEQIEALRDQIVSAEAGEAVKKLLLKKFNEKLISLNE